MMRNDRLEIQLYDGPLVFVDIRNTGHTDEGHLQISFGGIFGSKFIVDRQSAAKNIGKIIRVLRLSSEEIDF